MPQEDIKTYIITAIDDLNCMTYDANPIGPDTEAMLHASNMNILDGIKQVRNNLDKIEEIVNNRTSFKTKEL
jgi:hypothetical protein